MNETTTTARRADRQDAPPKRRDVARRAVVIFLPGFALSLAVTAAILFASNKADMAAYRSEERHTVVAQAANIDSDIRRVSSDLISIASQNEIRPFWDDDGVLLPGVLTALAREYYRFSADRQLYDQVRLIDEHGMEIMRVNFNDGHPAVVPQEELQDKQGRYYFDDAFKLARGEVFVSPLDLNIEHGTIEKPLKPMIRFATPVFGQRGEKRGIVLLNYFGTKLLERFSTQAHTPRGGQAMLLNADGYWLYAAKPEDEWGFMYEDRRDRTLATTLPETWERLRSEESGQFETPHGLFTFRTVYPLLEGQKSSTGSGSAFAPSQAQLETKGYYWKIVSLVPSKILYAARSRRRMVAAAVLTILWLLMFIVTWRMAEAVTHRRQAQQRLRESEARLDSMIGQASDSIVEVGFTSEGDPYIKDCNEATCKMYGYTREEMIGRPMFELDGDLSRDEVRDMGKRALDDGVPTIEAVHIRKDGSRFPVEVNSQTVRVPGRERILVSVVRDISERKQAEEELAQHRYHLEELVEQRTTELAFANKELESFSYSVSHDLRAPLRGLVGFSQALLEDYDKKLDEQGRHYLLRIAAAGRRMAELIEDMLTLSRVTRSRMRLETVDLSAAAKQVVASLREGQAERKVEFVIADGLGAMGDKRLLEAVLENLLGNAWKFTSRHPTATIEFGVTDIESERVYFVRDDGAGFRMGYADKLFGAFQRLHSEEEFPGTGIGLATVQRIVRRHGGRIWAEGEVEKGATFYFTLPATSQPDQTAPGESPKREETALAP